MKAKEAAGRGDRAPERASDLQRSSPAAAELVRDMRHHLDQIEVMLRQAPAAGFDTCDALENVAILRQLLDLHGAPVAAAFWATAWLDRRVAEIKPPDPVSRGGKVRAGRYQQRDAELLATARRCCPGLLECSDRAAARWLVEHDRAGGMDSERVRKILGRHRRKKLAAC